MSFLDILWEITTRCAANAELKLAIDVSTWPWRIVDQCSNVTNVAVGLLIVEWKPNINFVVDKLYLYFNIPIGTTWTRRIKTFLGTK